MVSTIVLAFASEPIDVLVHRLLNLHVEEGLLLDVTSKHSSPIVKSQLEMAAELDPGKCEVQDIIASHFRMSTPERQSLSGYMRDVVVGLADSVHSRMLFEGWPYKLIHLVSGDRTMEERLAVEQEFLAPPPCCLDVSFSRKLQEWCRSSSCPSGSPLNDPATIELVCKWSRREARSPSPMLSACTPSTSMSSEHRLSVCLARLATGTHGCGIAGRKERLLVRQSLFTASVRPALVRRVTCNISAECLAHCVARCDTRRASHMRTCGKPWRRMSSAASWTTLSRSLQHPSHGLLA